MSLTISLVRAPRLPRPARLDLAVRGCAPLITHVRARAPSLISWPVLTTIATGGALFSPSFAASQVAAVPLAGAEHALVVEGGTSGTSGAPEQEREPERPAPLLRLRLDAAYSEPAAAFREGMAMAMWLASVGSPGGETQPPAQREPGPEAGVMAEGTPGAGPPRDEDEDEVEVEDGGEDEDDGSRFHLDLHGYGEMDFAYHDFGPDQTGMGGAPPDSRAVFDQTRFALVIEAELGGAFEFEAEIEFEHGGTGAELELEYEEFGEYELDVDRGGEVAIEEMVLRRRFDGWLTVGIGRLYVAVGLLAPRHLPTQYLGSTRPESETRVLPAVWDEMGIQAQLHLGPFELTLQVVTGLDSSGFSSQYWVSSGHQQRFELMRASDLAFAGRFDVRPVEGVLLGVSGYIGATTGNRPKPDLADAAGEVGIASGHFSIDLRPVRAQGAFIFGYLSDSGEISDRNRRLSNNLGVLRSPVASQAIALWAELGFDVLHFTDLRSEHRLEPFVRAEWYDTMFAVESASFDNPRFERIILSGGLGYTYDECVVLKLDFTHRRFGNSELRPESTVRLGVGFTY